MGLDMELKMRVSSYKCSYIFEGERINAPLSYPNDLEKFRDKLDNNFMSSVDTNIDYGIGYWRKFNALHKWIVENCNNGVDDCKDIFIFGDNLNKIISILEEVSSDHTKAPKLLPTCDGFFFGSKAYDEWYYKDVDYSLELFKSAKSVIEKNDKYRLVYCASW